MLQAVLRHGQSVAVCTIYEPRFPDASLQAVSVTALSIFNDVILRAALRHELPLLDLRLVFDEDADYANAIEPSSRGGDKLACEIAALVTCEGTPIGAAGRWR